MGAVAGFIAIILILLICSSIVAWYNQNYQNGSNYYPYEYFTDTSPVTVGQFSGQTQNQINQANQNMSNGSPTPSCKAMYLQREPAQIPDVIQPELPAASPPMALDTKAYPMFSNSLPAEDVSPSEDMTQVADNYLQLNKTYKFDGNKFIDFPADYYLLDDGASGNYAGANNICSKSCCAPQWPVPFKSSANESICNNPNLVGTNYACNSTFQNAGCMCMTKDQAINISTRGGNAGKDMFIY